MEELSKRLKETYENRFENKTITLNELLKKYNCEDLNQLDKFIESILKEGENKNDNK